MTKDKVHRIAAHANAEEVGFPEGSSFDADLCAENARPGLGNAGAQQPSRKLRMTLSLDHTSEYMAPSRRSAMTASNTVRLTIYLRP